MLDEEYVDAIKEEIEYAKEWADDPKDVDVFYVFDVEELVFKTRLALITTSIRLSFLTELHIRVKKT